MQRTAGLNTRTISWLAILALLGGHCMAGPVHALFGREILGIPWTATKAEIVAALPGGRWVDKGPLQTYTVADAATVFHVRRTAKQSITVALNADGKIDSVAIGFPNGSETHLDLLQNLTEYLGEPLPADTTVARDHAGRSNVSTIWEDNGLRVTLLHSIVTPTFTSNVVTIARIPVL